MSCAADIGQYLAREGKDFKKWCEKQPANSWMVSHMKVYYEVKEDLEILFGRAGRFEAAQQVRVEVLVKALNVLKDMTPGGKERVRRVLLGMPLLPPTLEMDWQHDVAVVAVNEEDLGAAESGYGFSCPSSRCLKRN